MLKAFKSMRLGVAIQPLLSNPPEPQKSSAQVYNLTMIFSMSFHAGGMGKRLDMPGREHGHLLYPVWTRKKDLVGIMAKNGEAPHDYATTLHERYVQIGTAGKTRAGIGRR
jgi:hypothetical protein